MERVSVAVMFCTKCGKEINENANFCVYCGAPVIIEDVKTESVEKQASISPTTDTIKSAMPSSTKDVVIKNKTSGISVDILFYLIWVNSKEFC